SDARSRPAAPTRGTGPVVVHPRRTTASAAGRVASIRSSSSPTIRTPRPGRLLERARRGGPNSQVAAAAETSIAGGAGRNPCVVRPPCGPVPADIGVIELDQPRSGPLLINQWRE